MMKTFAILFFILTIMNIPLCFFFASVTKDNNYLSFNSVFQYFTLGNIGEGQKMCGYSEIDYYESPWERLNLKEPSPVIYRDFKAKDLNSIFMQAAAGLQNIELKCDKKYSYIQNLDGMGFLYLLNLDKGDFSEA